MLLSLALQTTGTALNKAGEILGQGLEAGKEVRGVPNQQWTASDRPLLQM